MIVMQALAVGLPVICHDIGGMSAAIDESCGIKVPLRGAEDSVREFADAIARLVEGKELVNELSEGALSRAQALSWEENVRKIATTYDVILDQRATLA